MIFWMKLFVIEAAILNFAVQGWYFTHMLQLNSYRPERYKKWCLDNEKKLVTLTRMLPCLTVFCIWLAGRVEDWITYAVCGGILLLSALLNWPKKAKKPLVVTARVKRLFITEAVLCGALLAMFWFLPLRGAALLGLCHVVIWLFVGLANRINIPVENKISQGFVKDAQRRLADRPDLTVVGIAGSYGKTSVKSFLSALLAVKYNVLMTPGNFNTTLGVVRTIREYLRPSHQVFVCEMGAMQKNDIQEICDLVHPTYGILTSIGEQHLETFG